tara:strand:+ start:115 stop:756 length:642 start_codon:yes stop_codon:yes gene_type:complete
MNDKNVTLKIWNPNVAACLSIIFTPIFGAWIHAKNWEVLKKEQERRWSMLFVYCLISVTIFVVYYQLFIGDVKSSPLSIGTLLTWYFILGKSQLSHIKDNNINYEKKSWIKPLLCGVGGYIILFGISISLITIAPLTKDDIKITSQELVNQILNEQLNEQTKCESVTITEEIEEGNYKAVAKLDDGNDLKIFIEVKDKMVYVSIEEYKDANIP